MTKHLSEGPLARDRSKLLVRLLACGVVVLAVVPVLAGCTGATSDGPAAAEATGTVKGHGVAVTVRVTPEMVATKPAPPVLATPEEAVGSYLDWVSYAYRIGNSDVAKPAMSVLEEVRVNSYLQYNLQEHSRLIDQQLGSIVFGTPVSKDASTTVVPATEKWSYKWVSAAEAGKVVGGPFSAEYETKYTVVRNPDGTWLVDRVEAKKLGKE